MKTKMNLRWRWLLGLSLMLCWFGVSGPEVQAQELGRTVANKMMAPATATTPGKVVASVPTADLPTVKVAQYRRGRKSAQTDTVRFTAVWAAGDDAAYPFGLMLVGEGEGVIDWGDGTQTTCSTVMNEDGTDYEFGTYQHVYTAAAEDDEREITIYTTSSDLQIVGLQLYYYTDYDVHTLHSGVDVRSCPSLKYLYCSNNWLGSLDVTRNTALTELAAMRCRLTSFTLPQSATLELLGIGGNQLTSLDVSGCPALTQLSCLDNRLTSLDVTQNTALKQLYCNGNRLSSLNVAQNTDLTHLYCWDNVLTSLNVRALTQLQHLSCSFNQLTDLDLSQNTALKLLYAGYNALTSLDVSNNTVLDTLDCPSNQLGWATLGALSQLGCSSLIISPQELSFEVGLNEAVDLSGYMTYNGQQTVCDFSTMPASAYTFENGVLKINRAGAFTVPMSNPAVKRNGEFQLINCNVSVGAGVSDTVRWVWQQSGGIEYVDLTIAGNATSIIIDWGDGQIKKEEVNGNGFRQIWHTYAQAGEYTVKIWGNNRWMLSGLEFFSDSHVQSLDLSDCPYLESLACPGNDLTALDLSACVSLKSLNCYQNQLSSLNVSGCMALTQLYCHSNQLTALDLTEHTALTDLNCNNNQLTSLDVTKNVNLKSLNCYDNQLSSLNVMQNTALTYLSCSGNQLSSLDVTQNTALTYLFCSGNQLSSLNVAQNTALEQLECGNNQLTSLDVSQNTALESLGCYNNQLTSLDVSQNTALELLECGNNRLTSLDVSQNTALQQLWCAGNQLTSLDVSQNVNLEKLVCSENRLTSLNTGAHTWFETLYCSYNQLGWAALDALSELGGNIDLTPQRLPSLEVGLNEDVDLSEYATYNGHQTEFAVTPEAGYTLNNGILSLQRSGSYKVSMSNPGVAWHGESVIIECRLTAWPGVSDTLRWVWAVRDTASGTFDLYAEGDSSFIVKWGDDRQDTVKMSGQVTSGIVTHSYAEVGEYAVTVYGLKHFMPLGLDLSGMNVQSLDVHACPSLETLSCGSNQLTELDLSKNKVLNYLSCESNQLTSLDVSQNTALTIVYCFYNQLGWADLDALSELGGSISPQQLSFEVDLNEEVDLSGYMTYNGQQTEFDFSNISASAYTFTDGKLQFSRPGTYVVPMSNPAVKTKDGASLLINCGSAVWPVVPDTVRWIWQQPNDANVSVNLDMKYDEGFMIDWGDGTVEKSESWYQIKHTYAEAGEYAVTVYGVNRWVLFGLEFFGGGSFRSLDVSACPYLESLSCYNNGLTSLDVSKNTALTFLNCYANQLTSLDVSKNTALASLDCSDNGLTSLDVSNNTALKTLNCSVNQLTELDLSGNTALEDLICYHNQLTELNVSKNTALKTLNCSGNQLTSLDLTQNTALETWDASYNIRILVLDEDRTFDLSTLPGMDVSRISNVEGGLWLNPQMVFNWLNVTYDYETGQGTVQFILEEAIIRDTVYMTWTAEAGQEKSLTVGIGAEGGNDHAIYWVDFGDGDSESANVYGPATLSHTYKASGTYNVKVSLDWDGRIKLFNCDGLSRRTGNGVTFLDVSACTALETLSCNNNNLTALDLSQNTALTSLSYNNNPSLDLDVSQLSDLMELYCADNQLTSLNLSQNTTLRSLYCYNNQLSSLDVSSNRLLKTLSCSNNRLTSLNLAQNTRLEELYCDNNQLTSLDLSKNTALTSLSCNNNQLTSLDVTATPTGLQTECHENYRIVSLDANRRFDLGTLPGMDVSRVRNVTGGELEGSQLTFKAGVEKVTYDYKIREDKSSYETFSIGTSPLTPEDPGTTPRDTIFMTLGSSGWLSIGVGADDSWVNKNLNFFEEQWPNTVWVDWGDGTRSYYNPLTATLEAGAKIAIVNEDTGEPFIDEETGEPLVIELEHDMEFDQIASIGVKKGVREIMISVTDPAIHLTFLNANSVGMTSLEISSCPSLQSLDCSSNTLKALDLTRNQMLKNLACGGNQLKSLDLSACSALTELNSNNSELTSLDVSGCPVLKKLDCSSSSSLSSLIVGGCSTLEELNCSSCALMSLDVSGCSALKTLNCGRYYYEDDKSSLEALDVSGCSALETLYCYNNSLTALDVSDCLALKTLQCYNNRLMVLDMSSNVALTTLDCNSNRLTELVLTDNDDLRSLNCSNNQLTSLDLSRNYDLSYLNCRDNSRMVVLDANRGFDLSTLPGMDVSRISNVWGATKSGSRLYFDNDAVEVTYDYSTKYIGDGNYKTVEFRLTAAPVYNDTVYLTWTAEAGAAKTLQVGVVADENWTFEEGETTFGVDWGDGTRLYSLAQEDTSFTKTYATAGTYAVKVWGHSPVRIGTFGCSGNGITALDVSACTELASLNCANNQLVALDLSGNMKLETVYCNDNRLENLALSYYDEALGTLYCQNNRLSFSDIAALPVLGYDIERCLSPQCDFYDTISIEEGFPMPEPLMVNGSATEIAVYTADLVALSENNGYTIHDGRLYFDEAGTYRLVVSNGAIHSLYESKWEFYSESTYITVTDDNVPDPVDGNDLAVWTWTKEGNGALETNVLFAGTPGGSFVIDWGDGEQVRVVATGESVNYTHTYGTAGQVEWKLYATTPASRILKLQKVSEVGLANETLNVSGCPELTYLAWVGCENCGGGLTALDVSQNLKLERLYCYYNQLTELDVTRNTALKMFSCEENLLTSVGMPQGVTLDAVYFGGNRIPFTALTNISATQKYLWPQSLSDSIDVQTGITLPMVNGTPVNVEVWRGDELLAEDEGYTVRLDSIFFKLYFAQAGDYRLIQWHDAFLENFLQTNPFGDLASYERVYHDTTLVTVTGKLPDTVTPGPGPDPADDYDLAVWTWSREGNGDLETSVSFAGTEGGSFVIDWGDGEQETVESTGERIKYTHIYDMAAQVGPTDTVFGLGRTGQIEWQLYATTPESHILELVKVSEVSLDNETLDVSACPELTILAWVGSEDCGGSLTALDVSHNLKLETLSCHINRLTSLDVTQNTALTSLSCSYNPLMSLDLTKNAKLEGLWCYDNRLTALDVTKNTALTLLSCGTNQLTSLDVTKNRALTSLSCSYNPLMSLDLTKNAKLEELWCYDNRLTSLDVTQNTALTLLSCGGNQLTSLDLTQNMALERLACYDNRLTFLDVTGNTALLELLCGNNLLTSLDVTQNVMLESLNCYGDQLTSLDLTQNTALTFLNCRYNQLTSLDVSDCMALEVLSCSNNQLTSLDLTQNTKLATLTCEFNYLPLSVLATFKDVSSACLSPQRIACETQPGKVLDLRSEMRIGATQTVYTVLKDGKPVDSTAYTMNADGVYGQLRFKTPGQYRLSLSNAEVTENFTRDTVEDGYWPKETPQPVYVYYDITVEQPIVQGSGAGWMWLASAGAEKQITFEGSEKGFRIDWGDEAVSDVESGLATHRYAEGGVYTVKIESLSKEGRLTSLDVSNGEVAMIWFEDASQLKSLNCSDNQLSALDLSALSNLTDYNCARNLFTSLDLTSLAQLQTVDFSGNQLTTVSLPTHSNLKAVKGTDNHMRLSTLYGLLSQRVEKASYGFDPQGDSIYVMPYQPIDLSAEMNIGGNTTTYVVTDADGRPVQASDYTETNGTFQFPAAGQRYKVTLMNMGVMEYQNGNPQKPVTFVLEITVSGAANEELAGSDACVYVRNRSICLSEDLGEMRVYTVLGRCIYKGHGQKAEVPCAGLYVVQAGGHTWKVVVR